MSRHRQEQVRPRYGRIAVLGSSVAVTLIAVLGGTGIIPTPGPGSAASTGSTGAAASGADDLAQVAAPEASTTPSSTPTPTPRASGSALSGEAREAKAEQKAEEALPDGSGTGKRVVFSEERQRVWLVDAQGKVQRTYPVSGSIYDNLDPGTFSVYSRSEQAYGIDDSGTMKYFVRFTQGENAAIGFHDIPIDNGKLVQTAAQLGTPLSHGCIRQLRPDAIALWRFAPLGTKVVVTV